MRATTAPECNPSSPDPYSTHLPILRRVLNERCPKRVLEFGGGDYSTAAFLRSPWVEELCVVETNAKWRRRLKKFDDPRLQVKTSGRPDPSDYDLVFIDDGDNAKHREQTIRYVLSTQHPLTVIHDSERYLDVIDSLSQHYEVFNYETPGTAVCW